MTPERLRAYWFGGIQVPFWNHDPRQLQVGLEVEYFIAHRSGTRLRLAKQDDFRRVTAVLVRDHGYVDRNLPDQPGRISKDTTLGFVAIKPDFAWHILEIALPPRHATTDVVDLLAATLKGVDQALAEQGLVRLPISCLPDVPEEMELVDLQRLRGFAGAIANRTVHSAFAHPNFPAFITATHLHFNIFRESTLAMLPNLYAQESDTIRRFARPEVFKGKNYDSCRSLFYQESLGTSYLLCNIPRPIPASIEEYCALYNQTPKIFPEDRFFPARDLTYIRPSRHGTLEFRSCSSLTDLTAFCELIEFRRMQIHQNSGSVEVGRQETTGKRHESR